MESSLILLFNRLLQMDPAFPFLSSSVALSFRHFRSIYIWSNYSGVVTCLLLSKWSFTNGTEIAECFDFRWRNQRRSPSYVCVGCILARTANSCFVIQFFMTEMSMHGFRVCSKCYWSFDSRSAPRTQKNESIFNLLWSARMIVISNHHKYSRQHHKHGHFFWRRAPVKHRIQLKLI